MIAALYVLDGGPYFGIPGVDPWPEGRDARTYAGPWPVVAHPPCARWCRLAGLVEARWGHKKGDDGGTFAAALESVREFGGALEHPAYSDAWSAHGLNKPPTGGEWVSAGIGDPGWTCYVEQGRYGHPARKATWLYAVAPDLPALRWGRAERYDALVGWCGNHTAPDDTRPRVGKDVASRSPAAFRDVLLEIARSASK